MDPQDVIAMALEIVLERERQSTRTMKESLRSQQVAVRKKGRERSMLKRKKKEMLAKEGAKKKLIDDFMVFITAIENNDLETAQNFYEKAMMNTIATMMNTGSNGGFSGGYGDNNLPEIDLGLEEKAAMDAILALENGVGSSGGDDGGFAGVHGGISNTPDAETAHNLGEEDKMTAAEGTNSDVSEGSEAGDSGGSFSENRRK